MKLFFILFTLLFTPLLTANESSIKQVFLNEADSDDRLYLLQDNTLWESKELYSTNIQVQYNEENQCTNLDSFYHRATLSEGKEETFLSLKRYISPVQITDMVDFYFKLYSARPDFKPENFSVDVEKGTITYEEVVVVDELTTNRSKYEENFPKFLSLLKTHNTRLITSEPKAENWNSNDSLIAFSELPLVLLINFTTNVYSANFLQLENVYTVKSCDKETISFAETSEVWHLYPKAATPLSLNSNFYTLFTSSEIITEELKDNPIFKLFLNNADLTPLLGKTIQMCIAFPEEGDQAFFIWRLQE